VELFGRLAPGVSVSAARADVNAISKRLQSAYPAANKNRAAFVEPYSALGAGALPAGMFARLFLVVGALALLIVCANTANLMLSRAVLRQREMAVRQTLGASRGRIFRMLLAEGLAISFTALTAAGLFTIWASRAIPRLMQQNQNGMQVNLDFSPDWRVAVYGVALAVFSTLAVTVAPTVRAWRQELLPSSKPASRA